MVPPVGIKAKNQGASAPASAFALRGYANKCIDVPGGNSADGAQLQLWNCNGTHAQEFSHGPNGSLVALDKCMDVAWASQDNGAKVQLAYCSGGPAQVWVRRGRDAAEPALGQVRRRARLEHRQRRAAADLGVCPWAEQPILARRRPLKTSGQTTLRARVVCPVHP